MENNSNLSPESINHLTQSAQSVSAIAQAAGEEMAIQTLGKLDRAYEDSMSQGASLWLQEKCDPAAIAAIGQQAAVFNKTGRKQMAAELMLYSVTSAGIGWVALYVLLAPLWAYMAALPVSFAFALGFALSGSSTK